MHLLGLGSSTSLHSDWLRFSVMASTVKRSFLSETSKKHIIVHIWFPFVQQFVGMYVPTFLQEYKELEHACTFRPASTA